MPDRWREPGGAGNAGAARPGKKSTKIRTQQADGVPACKAMIDALLKGETKANF